MNMSLVTMEDNYDAIDADDYSYHGYYIIKFTSYPYTLQANMSSDGRELIYLQSMSIIVTVFYKKSIQKDNCFLKGDNQCQCQHNML